MTRLLSVWLRITKLSGEANEGIPPGLDIFPMTSDISRRSDERLFWRFEVIENFIGAIGTKRLSSDETAIRNWRI